MLASCPLMPMTVLGGRPGSRNAAVACPPAGAFSFGGRAMDLRQGGARAREGVRASVRVRAGAAVEALAVFVHAGRSAVRVARRVHGSVRTAHAHARIPAAAAAYRERAMFVAAQLGGS